MYLSIPRPRNRFGWIERDLNRWMDQFFNGGSTAETEYGWTPRLDINETNDAFVVKIDLPGMTREDIKVRFENGYLIVSGERKYEHVDDDKEHYTERFHGKFTRSVRLPQDIEAGKVAATYKNGVLEVTLPKVEEVKPKEIEVKVA